MVAIGVCFLARHFNVHRILRFAAVVAVLCISNTFEAWAFVALPFIWLYTGKLGQKNPVIQYGSYLFYPVHLMVLAFIRMAGY
ncbi:MAG: hypothetical protein IJ679_01480 [Lachnospiraceae bacterium]|nr:hypothetical protein [Lachnospiraceae bacterium]